MCSKKIDQDSSRTTIEDKFNQFLLARGGPFYALQRQLGLLQDKAFHAGSRALLIIGLAWGVPLVITLFSGTAFGTTESGPYLLEPSTWARYVIAAGLFILIERQVELSLRSHLIQFIKAPLLAPESFEAAAAAITRALHRRDAFIAETICLTLALLMSILLYAHFLNQDTSNWAVHVAQAPNSLTLAGWWVVIVSNPIYLFLMLRWLWRMIIWGMLLRDLAELDLRLVATHPDGNGGLAFISQYPNAYAMFVFAISCVLGASLANALLDSTLTVTTYGYILAGWLLIVMLVFAVPLMAFNKPLKALKKQTLLSYDCQASRHNRAVERELLGRNIIANSDTESAASDEIPDPAKAYAATQKLSTMLFSRASLVPLSAASLLPLIAAGATQLPLKEIIKAIKPLLLL